MFLFCCHFHSVALTSPQWPEKTQGFCPCHILTGFSSRTVMEAPYQCSCFSSRDREGEDVLGKQVLVEGCGWGQPVPSRLPQVRRRQGNVEAEMDSLQSHTAGPRGPLSLYLHVTPLHPSRRVRWLRLSGQIVREGFDRRVSQWGEERRCAVMYGQEILTVTQRRWFIHRNNSNKKKLWVRCFWRHWKDTCIFAFFFLVT